MSDTNPGGAVATIKTADLVALWGDEITVKRSKRDNCKFPLYLSTKTGPVHLNTVSGQDFLLENGTFYGADNPPSLEKIPEESPEVVEPPPEPHPVKKHGEGTLLGWLDKDIL